MTTTVSNGTPCGLETDSRSDSSTPSLSPDDTDTELDNVTHHSRPPASSGNSHTGPENNTDLSVNSESDVAGWWLPADGHAVVLVLNFELIAKIVASLPLLGFLFCFFYSILFQFDQVIDKDCPVCKFIIFLLRNFHNDSHSQCLFMLIIFLRSYSFINRFDIDLSTLIIVLSKVYSWIQFYMNSVLVHMISVLFRCRLLLTTVLRIIECATVKNCGGKLEGGDQLYNAKTI